MKGGLGQRPPMIDTRLQLFMIFLLTASFAGATVKLNLPKAGGGPQGPASRAVVSLDAEGKLYLSHLA